MAKYQRLIFEERVITVTFMCLNLTLAEIGLKLNRSTSSISRGIRELQILDDELEILIKIKVDDIGLTKNQPF